MKLYIIVILFFGIYYNNLFAQDKQSRKSAKADSLKDSPFAHRDTLETIKVESKLYWYDIENQLKKSNEKSQYTAYYFTGEKGLIYNDMSDIFSNQSLWFDYDLRGRGRPAYISSINKYPHQTAFFYNSVMMNDPIHGMFNSQFIPLNFIHTLETDFASGQLQNYGTASGSRINITPHSMHTVAPWSKIVYKQGSYGGYSDLDISFVKPISERLAFQLGGIHKTFDGIILSNTYVATNYRAEITWQYSPNLYFKGQMFLNREKVELFPISFQQEIRPFEQSELRDDYFIDLTWLPNDSIDQRLHFVFFNSFSYRKLKDKYSGFYKLRTYNKRFGFDTNFNFSIGDYQVLIGTGAIIPRISGWAFKKTYYPYLFNTYGKMNIPISNDLELKSTAQMAYMKGFSPHLIPTLQLNFKPSDNHLLSLSATSGIRYPNVTERFFDHDTLSGNSRLVPEEYISITGSYQFTTRSNLQLTLNAGYDYIDKEIQWKEFTFLNTDSRDFKYIGAKSSFKFWKIDLSFGGQYTFADLNLTPRSNVWGQGHFHDVWLKGAVIIDAYGTVNYFDMHRRINFEPRLDRFFIGSGNTSAYKYLSWKIVATVQDAKIFFEMDNALSENYEVIHEYPEGNRYFRFGVNWILWD